MNMNAHIFWRLLANIFQNIECTFNIEKFSFGNFERKSFSMQTIKPKQMGSPLSQNMCQTLPITCQICLGIVKNPRVCSNLHAFCSNCIDSWLEKGKHCPSCRVPINEENPCKPVLGGTEHVDDQDSLRPSDFSH